MSPDTTNHLSPASAALLGAVDEVIAGNDVPYPDRAAFIDADEPHAGQEIARAATQGRAVVLCSADGTRQVLYPSHPAVA